MLHYTAAGLQFVHQVGFSLEPCTMLTVPVDFLSTTVPGFDVDPGYYCMGNLLVLGPKRGGGGAGAKALQRRTSPCWGGARGCANLLHCFSRVCSRMDADLSHVLGGRQTVQNVLPYHTCPNRPLPPYPVPTTQFFSRSVLTFESLYTAQWCCARILPGCQQVHQSNAAARESALHDVEHCCGGSVAGAPECIHHLPCIPLH